MFKVVLFCLVCAVSTPVKAGALVITSWYGKEWASRKMANGERFNPRAFTAAHLAYAFGTHLLLTHPKNGKRVQVVVKDRGPYARGRGLDISEAAAERLGIKKRGVATVLFQKVR